VRRSERQAIREIPAAALTAYARSEDRTKALRSGFQLHLAKPVDPGELMAAMAALAKRAGATE
jgi:CheY-like chemotaxis protein